MALYFEGNDGHLYKTQEDAINKGGGFSGSVRDTTGVYTYDEVSGKYVATNEAAKADVTAQEQLVKDLEEGNKHLEINTPDVKIHAPTNEEIAQGDKVEITDASLKTEVEYNEDGTVKSTTTTHNIDQNYVPTNN